MFPTSRLNRKGSPFTTGTEDLYAEKKEPSKKHIAGKWHIITLQEAIEYLDHEYLTNRFYVTHHGCCAILFNKDTSHQDIKVTSVYLHDTKDPQQQDVKEGESGWVLQGVISRASFRRLPRNGKSFFSTMSSHIYNQFAKKRVIGKKLLTIRAVMQEVHVDLVAGDFNGAAWRRPCDNIIDGAFCQYGSADGTWPHTIVAPRCSARRMGGCMRISQVNGLP